MKTASTIILAVCLLAQIAHCRPAVDTSSIVKSSNSPLWNNALPMNFFVDKNNAAQFGMAPVYIRSHSQNSVVLDLRLTSLSPWHETLKKGKYSMLLLNKEDPEIQWGLGVFPGRKPIPGLKTARITQYKKEVLANNPELKSGKIRKHEENNLNTVYSITFDYIKKVKKKVPANPGKVVEADVPYNQVHYIFNMKESSGNYVQAIFVLDTPTQQAKQFEMELLEYAHYASIMPLRQAS